MKDNYIGKIQLKLTNPAKYKLLEQKEEYDKKLFFICKNEDSEQLRKILDECK